MTRITLYVFLALCTGSVVAQAQWLNHRTPGIPRLPDGKPDLTAATPRLTDGKPDLSGIWLPELVQIQDVPLKPETLALYRQRMADNGRDDPASRCIPGAPTRLNRIRAHPFRIMTSPSRVIILYEVFRAWREIFMDGRPLPVDPQPTWMGYSIGHWSGDELVVESAGFNDKGWLDQNGLPSTERLRIEERFLRKDFGHMEVRITVDDAGAYLRPWTVAVPLVLQADTELLEYICSENNRYVSRPSSPLNP